MAGSNEAASPWWVRTRIAVADWWASQPPANRIASIGGAGIVVGAIVGVVVVLGTAGGANANDGAVVASTTTATSGPSASATSTLPPSEGDVVARSADEDGFEAAPEPRPPGPPTIRDLGTFVSEYGDPPGADFARLRIPSLGVDAPVGARAVGEDGHMAVPAGPADTVWYDMSTWPGLGGTPGSGQNAIVSGHVDYADLVPYAEVLYNGVGVFVNLNQLSPGDIIEMDYQGQTLRYAVDWRQEVEASSANWNDIFTANTGRDSLTLITCGGEFDFTSRSYVHRTVVRAVRI
ncbi:MAG: class F sortase [Dehalococcoidia bacterium]